MLYYSYLYSKLIEKHLWLYLRVSDLKLLCYVFRLFSKQFAADIQSPGTIGIALSLIFGILRPVGNSP